MNQSIWNRLRRVLLAIALGAATLGALVWWAVSTRVALADDTPLDGSVKAVAPSIVQPGELVTYTIVLSNSSTVSDVNVLLTDPLHPLLIYVPDSARTIPDGRGTLSDTAGITWTGVISANQAVTITFQAQVESSLSDDTTITNTATASSNGIVPLQLPAVITVDALSPSVLIMNPEAEQVLTSTNLLVSGVAWDGTDRPPFPADPVLNPINNNGSGYYVVSWNPADRADYYLLQEDTSGSFLSPTVRYADSGTQTFIQAQPPGTYYYRVRAVNDQGFSRWSNIVSATVTSLWYAPAGSGDPAARLLVPAQPASTLAGVWVRIDGSPWLMADGTSDWSYEFLLPDQDYAPHTVSAYTRDAVGHTSITDTIIFYVDRKAPTTTIDSLTPGQWISTTPYLITGTTGSDLSGVSRVEVSANGGETWQPASGTSEWTYSWTPTGLDGTYTVTARAIDGLGNVGTSSAVTVTVDQPPAAPAGLAVISTTASSAHLSWAAGTEPDIVGYRLYWGTTSEVYDNSCDVGNVTRYELTELESSRTYYIALSALDERNEGQLSDEVDAHIGSYLMYLPLITRRWPPIPYAPVLDEIENADGDGNYTVSWSYGYTGPSVDTYTLQEAADENFTDPTEYYPGTGTSQEVTGKDPGTYYYRVRGHNSYGAGEWSNTRSVTVLSLLHDDFDDPSTGWATRRTSSPDLGLINAIYSGGRLMTRVDDRFDFGIFSPMLQVPATPYSIRMRTRIVHRANEVSYGIVFGGNGGTPCPVDRSSAGDANGCFFHYYRLNVIWGGDYLKYQVKRIGYHEEEKGKARGVELLPWTNIADVTSHDDWNNWEIKVYDDGFAVYVNNHLLGWTDDTTYIHEPYCGILTSTGEYNSASFEHEYFYVDPMSGSATLPDSGYLVPGGVNWYRPLPQIEQIE